ncbi:uncharacterized protein LOC111006129 [Momordica charantia]|uniref:Uncharacterized protein LOC111006129 n=1 Tax=Momordica charantia TaxID=3673 RepID=A0A6J1BVP4_MOMCH|nr:uncharacterized protein LOC111006129 [Momordica charantia]
MGLRNPNHPRHDLELKQSPKPYICSGCKETGFGPRYHCAKCDFNLHETCMFPKILPSPHEFFPGSMFKFSTTPHKKCPRICDACMNPIKGFVYHCRRHDLDLHPCCRNLHNRYEIEDVAFNLRSKIGRQCVWCDCESIKDRGWSYVSECGEYHVHVACVTEMALQKWHSGGGDLVRSVDKTSHWLWRSNKDHSKAIKCWRILKIFVKTIVSIVLGDPTPVLASLFQDLIKN